MCTDPLLGTWHCFLSGRHNLFVIIPQYKLSPWEPHCSGQLLDHSSVCVCRHLAKRSAKRPVHHLIRSSITRDEKTWPFYRKKSGWGYQWACPLTPITLKIIKMAASNDGYFPAIQLSKLQSSVRERVTVNDRVIALFYVDGKVHALDHFCYRKL